MLTEMTELMVPRVHGIYNGAFYRNNAAGFRGRDYERPKPPGVFRIVIGGDSVTMGSGVREEEAYPALLEAALNQRGGSPRYEVLNLGLIGIDIRQVLNRIVVLGLRYDPDLIVYGCTLNDIKGPAYRKSEGPTHFERLERYRRFRESPSYLLRVLWPRWESLVDLVHPERGTLLYEIEDNYLHNPQAWSDFTAALGAIARIAADRHVPAVVFIHSSLEYLNVFHPYRRIYARIAAAAEERGLHAVQSFPFLRGHEETSLWVGPIDAHPNALGHRLLARALLDGLDRLPPAMLGRPGRTP
jgi:lysophospholipase L1-like esterase